jgi:beta-lactamase regulating signal transducer with metallopeptidase domain
MTAHFQAIAQAISAALLHFVWQGAAVALLLWITLAILGRRPARLRYGVSCAAFAVMSALPFVTAFLVYRAPGAAILSVGEPIVDTAVPAALAASTFLPRLLAAIEAWVLPVWSAGVMVLAIRFLRSATHVARLKRSGEPVSLALAETAWHLASRMGIMKSLRVLTSALADTPSVVGFLKPVILFPPAALMNLSTAQLESVLAHELAHIRRHDYLINLLQTIAETLFFYQPAIWWVSSQIRNERELCCDDMVVEICGDPVGYARALTQLERARLDSPSLALLSAGGPLMHRIQRLTGVAGHQPAPRASAALAAGLAMVCFLVNVNWAKAQSGREGDFKLDSVWIDTVKYGNLPITVRALGSLTTPTMAQLSVSSQLPAQLLNALQIGQTAVIDLGNTITVAGKVTQVDAASANGTVPVTVEIKAPMAEFAGHAVDGLVQIKTLHDVVFVGRPVNVAAFAETMMFKLEPDGQHWSRAKVRFGLSSVNAIQVAEGLQPGDKIIISDMAAYSGYDRLRGQ